MLLRALALMIALGLPLTGQAAEGRRVALIIGNSAYQHTAALANPKNDANDISSELSKLGFDVQLEVDLDKGRMDRAVRTFATRLRGAKLGVFFFAGHGLQVDQRNFLVPIDAKLEDPSGLDFEMIGLDLVQRTMERETSANVMFVDACRDNPLVRNLARALGTRSTAIGRGFAPVVSGEGTLIAFSTQPGNVALDGSGRNSPFTGALVKHISAKGEDLFSVLVNVRNDVMSATGRRQVPWDHSALTSRIYFNPDLEPRQPSPAEKRQAELALWEAVKDQTDPAILATYVEQFPNGTFAPTARLLIEKLKREIERNIEVERQTQELRRAEEARRAAEQAKIESERKAQLARQSEELRKAQEEVQKSREALAKAEQERESAHVAAEKARKEAAAAKADREAATGKQDRPAATGKSGSNCFVFNSKTYCR